MKVYEVTIDDIIFYLIELDAGPCYKHNADMVITIYIIFSFCIIKMLIYRLLFTRLLKIEYFH